MYHQLLEAYLTHYQPELKAELIKEQMLQSYLEEQTAMMQSAHARILDQLTEHYPQMSQQQRTLEADQMVRDCT
ncbi:MAG: hypothetical protein KDJ52_05000 [Anaerolineae bacterium]|nr:hypothetical protein [Anaerolineae bacterium]